MINPKNSSAFTDLRNRAEKILQNREGSALDPNEMELVNLFSDLEIHQVELELQNEELRHAQTELEISRNEYSDLFNSSPVGYVTTNAGGLISMVNRAACDIFGKSPPQLVGSTFSMLIHPEYYSEYYTCRKNVSLYGGKDFCEVRIIRNDGQPVFVRLEMKSGRSMSDNTLLWHFAMTDITRQKKAEAELKRSNKRLKQRTAELELLNREMQDFVFIASHDLKEPLRKIRTFGALLLEKAKGSLDEISIDYIARMQNAAARMDRLLVSLLEYSRVTTDTEPAEEIDLTKTIGDALSNLEILVQETQARIEIGDLPIVKGNRTRMVQLFQNLLQNALKFKKADEPPQIKIYARKGKEEADRVIVEDKGIGFDESYTDKIFVPFKRLHGKTEFDGVGMGLSICKKIMDRMGGAITARSEPGHGARFIVTFPTQK